MTDRPTVSAIIPVCNGEQLLGQAIRSVLDRTLPSDEVIVVDDRSTDGTAALVQRIDAGIRYANIVALPCAGSCLSRLQQSPRGKAATEQSLFAWLSGGADDRASLE